MYPVQNLPHQISRNNSIVVKYSRSSGLLLHLEEEEKRLCKEWFCACIQDRNSYYLQYSSSCTWLRLNSTLTGVVLIKHPHVPNPRPKKKPQLSSIRRRWLMIVKLVSKIQAKCTKSMDDELTVSEQSVSVSILQGPRSGQSSGSGVSVAQVVGASDLAQVRRLVEGGGGLVLGVAGRRQRREGGEVQRAVDDVAAAGEGVGQDVAGAGAVDVGAVGLAHAGRGRAALGRDLGEDARDLGAGGGGARLEVLVDLGGGARDGGGAGLGGERAAGGLGVDGGGLLGPGAVALHGGALGVLVELAADLVGRGAVDLGGERVGAVGQGAGELGAVRFGSEEGPDGDDVERASRGEVVDLGGLPFGLYGLASGDGLESIFGQVGGLNLEPDPLKGKFGVCITS